MYETNCIAASLLPSLHIRNHNIRYKVIANRFRRFGNVCISSPRLSFCSCKGLLSSNTLSVFPNQKKASDVLCSQYPEEVQNKAPLLYHHPLSSSNMLEKGPRVRQCTMIFPGTDRPHYERGLKTHVRHGERLGNPTNVLPPFLSKKYLQQASLHDISDS